MAIFPFLSLTLLLSLAASCGLTERLSERSGQPKSKDSSESDSTSPDSPDGPTDGSEELGENANGGFGPDGTKDPSSNEALCDEGFYPVFKGFHETNTNGNSSVLHYGGNRDYGLFGVSYFFYFYEDGQFCCDISREAEQILQNHSHSRSGECKIADGDLKKHLNDLLEQQRAQATEDLKSPQYDCVKKEDGFTSHQPTPATWYVTIEADTKRFLRVSQTAIKELDQVYADHCKEVPDLTKNPSKAP